MKQFPGQFNTFQLCEEKDQPGPTVELSTPFNKSSKKPRAPQKYIPSSAIAKVNMKLDSVEDTLNKYMPHVTRLIQEECINRKRSLDLNSTSSMNISDIDFDESSQSDQTYHPKMVPPRKIRINQQSVEYIDYRQVLIRHFFAVNEYCSYPRLLELTEFVNTFKNCSPPDYLLSAIFADSSLTSPHMHLHKKNMEFYEYHYQLCLKQMMRHLDKPNIILIQAILILWESDQFIGKFFRSIERMTCAIRLAQTLQFHNINDPSSNLYKMYSKPQLETIKKLWNVMKFRDHKIAQLLDRPALLPPYEMESNRDWDRRPAVNHRELLVHSASKLPSYYDAFLVHCPKLATILTDVTKFISRKNQSNSLIQSQLLVNQLDNWHRSLPNHIKYFPMCLSIHHRMNSPMITMRILSHLIMLNGKLVLLRYTISSNTMEWTDGNGWIEMIATTMKTCREQLKMLQDWFHYINNEMIAMIKDGLDDEPLEELMTPPFPIEYFYELGLTYLQLMKSLTNKRNLLKFKCVQHDYDQLIKLLDHFANHWEGGDHILANLTCWKMKIHSHIPLPEPLIQFNCDRYFKI